MVYYLFLQRLGLFSFFHDTDRDYHSDGSYTDRDYTSDESTTYGSDGKMREYSRTEVPLFGPSYVNTYDSNGNLVNSQEFDINKYMDGH